MSMTLGTMEEAEAFIRDRVRSKEWWVWIGHTSDSFNFITFCENKFYSEPERARQFDLIQGSLPGVPIFAVFFGHKRWMTKDALADAAGAEYGDAFAAALRKVVGPEDTQDIFIHPSTPVPLLEWFLAAVKDAA